MHIPKPFLPVKLTTEGLCHTAHLLDKSITFGANSLPQSIKVGGEELLAAPIRLCGIEDGETLVWDDNYPDNESESFVQRRADDEVVICGAMQSECFIADTAIKTSFEGCMEIDLKLADRGRTVSEVFGLSKKKERRYELERLWLEIPLRRELLESYTMHPNTSYYIGGEKIEKTATTYGGRLPDETMSTPFKTQLWLGGEKAGIGFFTESHKNWQWENEEKVIEVIPNGDELLLRVHLLDSIPKSWSIGSSIKRPIVFRFGLQITPTKPFPAQPYLHNALHLDCFIKVKGNYRDFLLAEKDGKNRFDRLKEKGVDTLILHEKWNKLQNCFELSEYTASQLELIVDECHKRGIKVLTYFGYELSMLSPEWAETGEANAMYLGEAQGLDGGWYRFPYQRDYVLCYNTEYMDKFVEGVTGIMDKFHTDGVYLDGTAHARCCTNTQHGCGWYDSDGKLCGTYPWRAIRTLFRRLYTAVEERGGIINLHGLGYNFIPQPFIHSNWFGEDLQFDYCKGKLDKFPLDFFRAAYTGRTYGTPVEMIVYANPPIWNFESGISMALIHGILPRPNDIEKPLDYMSDIWKVFNNFPFDKSEWQPYWRNGVTASADALKVSYYKYTAVDGGEMYMILCANIDKEPLENVNISLQKELSSMIDALTGEKTDTFDVCSYGYKIFFARAK
ncbi:MAG: hypothetical protein E7587_03935 [Ruminococcaceae bacterium]|nr:hypothetical protein [Oscillospiraceae bacterium]